MYRICLLPMHMMAQKLMIHLALLYIFLFIFLPENDIIKQNKQEVSFCEYITYEIRIRSCKSRFFG